MRPVNLIPPEDRRGDKAPTRTGPLAYLVVAALAVGLLAVTAVVLTGNQISDRKAEKANLESQVSQAKAEGARLQPFADFASVQETRQLTVASLAQSRFDWERVLRELAIVIPDDVWLTGLTAKVSSSAQVASSGSTSSATASVGASNVEGPSLDIQGCAAGHHAVATFLAALRDVDGVTRVSVLKSEEPDTSSSGVASASTGSASPSADCASRNFISQFEVVAAFDAAQLSATPGSATPAPSTAAPASATQSATSSGTASAADQSQVADGQQQLQHQKDSADQQTRKAHSAVSNFVPGTVSP